MTEHPGTEHDTARRVVDALATHSADLPSTPPDLPGVWRHVDRRRQRRRRVATVASLAVVGVGAAGLLNLRAGEPSPLTAGAAGGSPDQQAAWRCTDQLDHFEEGSRAVFFVTCEQVAIDGRAPIIDDLPDPTTPIDPATMMTTTSIFMGVPETAPVVESWYTVREGDTFESIARQFGTTPDEIARLNHWSDQRTERLQPGNVILVQLVPTATTAWAGVEEAPTPTVPSDRVPIEQEYVIRAGDSLAGVAARFGITLEQLVAYNEFPDGASHLILPGDVVMIPPDALADTESVVAATTTTTTTTSSTSP